MALIGLNIVCWFVLALLSDWLPSWAFVVVARVLSLLIAWLLPLIGDAVSVFTF